MNIHHFSQRMIELLPQLIRGIARQESNDLSRGKITLPQLLALEYLARLSPGEGGGVPMNALAKHLGSSRPAATGLIDRLIRQGLVRRGDDARDRRVVRVEITANGRKTLARIWEQKRRAFSQVFSQVSPADRRQYLQILERVVGTLAQEKK